MRAEELPAWFWRAVALALGAVWGSFGNVVVYRWPNELSVVSPPSHCPHCGKPVRAYDNVPVLAWLWLRGKCRDCKAPISARYPLVELAMALLSLGLAERALVGSPHAVGVAMAHFAVRFCVAFLLLVTALIDLDEMLVPSFLKWWTAVPLLGAALLPTVAPSVALVPAVAGAGLGYLGLRIFFIDGYRLLRGHQGMGLGDAEVLLLVGALLGPLGVLFSLCAGALQGLMATGLARVFGWRLVSHKNGYDDEGEEEEKPAPAPAPEGAEAAPTPAPAGESVKAADAQEEEDEEDDEEEADGRPRVPFVPFLALGALEYLLGGDRLLAVYLRVLGG